MDEALWPYDGAANHWPPTEPEGCDVRAKENRIRAYQRASTVDECRILVASDHPVVAAFQIDDSWVQALKGFIPTPNDQEITGSHAVCLIGYDDAAQTFIFQNSWGTGWGDAGYGYLPYSYFPQRLLEGWTVTVSGGCQPVTEKAEGIVHRKWGINDPFGNILHAVEIVDSIDDEMIAWGFAIQRKASFELEELFVRPNWRMRGYASHLTTEFKLLAARVGCQLRASIPHSDVGKKNQPALNAVLRRLGLSLNPSPVRWAAAVGA